MTAERILEIVLKQWCDLEDLMKISQVGRNSALKINQARLYGSKESYERSGDYLDINISYLESRIKKGEQYKAN